VILHEGDHAHQKMSVRMTGFETQYPRAAFMGFAQCMPAQRLLGASMQSGNLSSDG